MDKKTQTQHTYNVAAEVMAKKFDSIGPRIKDIEQAFSYIPKKDPNVLEIGCGNGRDAKEIVKRTSHYLGVDYSSGLLAIAHAELPDIHFELADIEEYEIPKNLDVIFSFASLLHTDKAHLEDVLQRSYEALNLGGVFFLSLKYAPYQEKVETDAWGTRTFYLYTPEDIQAIAGKFTIVYQHVFTAKTGQEWVEIILQK